MNPGILLLGGFILVVTGLLTHNSDISSAALIMFIIALAVEFKQED